MKKTQPNVVVFSLAVLALALLLIPVDAMASVQTNVTIPIDNELLSNPCNGEAVTMSGFWHMVATATNDGAGGFHNNTENNIHITGSGSLGNSYIENDEYRIGFNARVALAQTFVANLGMISSGSAPNFELHILLHVTQNANGTVTVFITNFSASCPA